MCEPGDADLLRSSVHGSLAFANAHYIRGCGFVWPILPRAFKQTAHIGYHWHFPRFAGCLALEASLGFRAHGNFASPEIAIRPGDVSGFVDAQPCKGEELDQFSARFRKTRATAFNLLYKFVKLIGFRQTEAL